ncbi:Uncharacterised protein [Salmonella enterica subsp. arizonae]|nr:Uncharacterised protein [Salmonella enterica subsp. arizonae]
MQITSNGWQRDIGDCAIQNCHRNTDNNRQDSAVSLWEGQAVGLFFFHKYFVISEIMS